jgi:hypothetical protein
VAEELDRMKIKGDEQSQVVMTLMSDTQAIKVAFEGIRKPFTTEMNNIRKENEGINRELNRITG